MGNSSCAHIAGDTRTFRWSIAKTDEIRVQQDDEHHFLASLAGRLGLKKIDLTCSPS